MEMTIATIIFWVVLISLVLAGVPPPFAKYWIQHNTEQSLQWILEAKNDQQ